MSYEKRVRIKGFRKVGLRSSAIVYPYCLQFKQAIVRGPLWGPIVAQANTMRPLTIAHSVVWESNKKWLTQSVNNFTPHKLYFAWSI
jgi:hypothetical protein